MIRSFSASITSETILVGSASSDRIFAPQWKLPLQISMDS